MTLKGGVKNLSKESDVRFSSSSWNAFIRDPETTGVGHFILVLVNLSVATNMRRNDGVLCSYQVQERVAVQFANRPYETLAPRIKMKE